MIDITLAPILDTAPIDALAERLHAAVVEGLVMTEIEGKGPQARVQALQVRGIPGDARIEFDFGREVEEGCQVLRPSERLSRDDNMYLHFGIEGRLRQVGAYAWTQFPLDGVVLPDFDHLTFLKITSEGAAWTSADYPEADHDSFAYRLHGFGLAGAPISHQGAHTTLRTLAQGARMKVIVPETEGMSMHALLQARAERTLVLSAFDLLDEAHPEADEPIVLSLQHDRVVVGTYTSWERQTWPLFSVG